MMGEARCGDRLCLCRDFFDRDLSGKSIVNHDLYFLLLLGLFVGLFIVVHRVVKVRFGLVALSRLLQLVIRVASPLLTNQRQTP